MSEAMIVCDGVWKKFSRAERHDSLRDLIPHLAQRMLSGPARTELGATDFWAVRDVSFEVRRGEALAIIGPNGAGKSTILKLLNRILRPTRGACMVRGTSGALIEVASGFHPDLTGRENVFLQGAIMKMSRADVHAKLDSIVDFAGVSDFIDTPVKRYSSGMNARLGFAIAAHLNPDALIIDEVLSVGDMAFQRRCIERMEAFRREGVAIAFVSHDLAAVARLCATTVLLNQSVVAIGPTAEILRLYSSSAITINTDSDGPMSIASAGFDGSNERSLTVRPGAALTLRVQYHVRHRVSDITFGLILRRTSDQLVVYDGNFTLGELGVDRLEAGLAFHVDFQLRAHVVRGHYDFECHVCHEPTQHFLCRVGPVCSIVVEETRTFAGVADLEVTPSLQLPRD